MVVVIEITVKKPAYIIVTFAHLTLTHLALKYFYRNHVGGRFFFQFEIIIKINVLVSLNVLVF